MTETIDSDEFRYLVDKVYAEGRYGGSGSDEIAALIAHIDEKHAKDAQDAARYRELRQQFKNNEASLELWGRTFKDADTVCGEDDLDEYCDAAMKESTP